MTTTPASRPIDVFISYARADVAEAERLETLLSAPPHNLNVWRDKTRLLPGEHVDFAIPDALRQAKAVLIVWSATSIASDWVRHEASYAVVEGKAATLSLAGFDYGTLPSVYRPLNCGDVADTLTNPTKLVARLSELADPARRQANRIDISRLPATFAKRLYGRDTEMADLNRAWDSSGAQKTNVLVLDAMGGTGKTALVNHFVTGLQTQGWRGAQAVFVWSFYSQGTDDKRQASADEFFKAALTWFGHTGDLPTSAHDKGVRLAALIAAKRALVILDGLEPLQYGPSRRTGGQDTVGMTGGLKDQGLIALVRQLARDNPGLLVVTTRLKVPDLKGIAAPGVINERLGPIPTKDGIELIRALGVHGKYEELRDLVEDMRGHAIALTQVATWLKNFRGGDVRTRDEIPSLVDLGGDDERHPFRVMLAYETQFKRQIAEQAAKGTKPEEIAAAKQLGLLFLMGLFDRPMESGDRDALVAKPPIPDITESLAGLTPGQLDYAVHSLRELGLLLPKEDHAPGELDAHPLVREYFGARLEKDNPEAWKAAHGRLYDYYRFRGLPEAFQEPVAYGVLALAVAYPQIKDDINKVARQGQWPDGWKEELQPTLLTADWDRVRAASKLIDGPEWEAALKAFLPESDTAMQPLYAAIAHGCAAGRHNEAFGEVYRPRIARGNMGYSAKMLGLYGSDLGAIAHFFAEPFAVPAAGLSASRQALVLNLAGFHLRALGRLGEAVSPFRANIKLNTHVAKPTKHNWQEAAGNASNLAQLLQTLGRLLDDPGTANTGAVTTAAQSVAYADKSGDAFSRMTFRTTHADALLAAGAWAQSFTRFAEAETLQRERQPNLPLLYTLAGFQWCDLKLAQGRADEVAARATVALDLVQRGSKSLLDIALNRLSLGRAAQMAFLSSHALSWGEGRSDVQVSLASAPHPNPLPARAGRGNSAAAYLDAAIDGLRAAGAVEFLTRGLLARAAFHRECPAATVGSDKLASADLAEAFEIAERGGMMLFLADCWIESAHQRLARAQPTDAAIAAAAKALDKAAKIITNTGYHRRDPDLALARAELALAQRDPAAARVHLDAVIATMRTHNLWSFLAPVARLAAAHNLADVTARLPDLHAARAIFDIEADAAFEQARKRADGLDDDLIDARLADPEFRAKLDARLKSGGYPPSGTTPLEEQRNDARQYIREVERKQQKPDTPDLSAIPDELVAQMLENPDFRTALDEAHTRMGLAVLADLSPSDQQEAARGFLAAMIQAQAGTESEAEQAEVQAQPDLILDPDPMPEPPAAEPVPAATPEPPKRGGVMARFFGAFMRRG